MKCSGGLITSLFPSLLPLEVEATVPARYTGDHQDHAEPEEG